MIFLVLVILLSFSYLMLMGGALLYFWKGYFKNLYHDILKWHEPDDSRGYFDGCNVHCRCKYCKKDIISDSQGNWY